MALLLLMATGCGRTRPAVVPPSVGAAEAVAVAPELRVGMSEREAQRILNKHGIPCYISLGCSHSWTCFGELTNQCSLALEMEPGLFGVGRLKAAYIQSNGVNIVSLAIGRR
jgi:hypothetical protein